MWSHSPKKSEILGINFEKNKDAKENGNACIEKIEVDIYVEILGNK